MSKKSTAPEIKDSDIRIAIWMLKTKKSKKQVCSFLKINYNTKRLDKIIEDFRAREQREAELKEKNKNKKFSTSEKELIAKQYLDGETQTALAKRFYVSAQRIKAILVEQNVPIRSRKKKGAADTTHVVQDLDKKFALGERVFLAQENSFACITEVLDEMYVEEMRQGRQRYVETYKPKKLSEPIEGIHYEIYWEANGKEWKLSALKAHLKKVETVLEETGRESYNLVIEGDSSYRKMYVPRANLFPVVMK